jgi:hypothetical protein
MRSPRCSYRALSTVALPFDRQGERRCAGVASCGQPMTRKPDPALPRQTM